MEKIPVSGEVYRHFTGELYRIVTMAKQAETGEELVVYQALYGEFGIFVLPLLRFAGKTDEGENRFTLVAAPEIVSGEAGKMAAAQAEGGSASADRDLIQADTAVPENETGLDAGLLAFLEAETYEEKLKVYSSLAGRADEHMLNTIAVSMDLELSGGSVEEQYDNLKSCLLTLERYECSRLR